VKRFACLLLAAALLAGCMATPEGRNRRGNQAFARQAYSDALRNYLSAQADAPGQPEPGYNAANTHYRQGDLLAAQARMRAAIAQMDRSDALLQDAYFNLGNIYYRMEAYTQAADSYREALRLNSEDADAKHNLELALLKLAQARAEEPVQPVSPAEEDPSEPEPTPAPDVITQQPAPNEGAEDAETAPGQPVPTLTPEQAHQLISAARESARSLQQALQQPYPAPGNPPAQGW